jgi:hypothetical protein
MKLLVSLAALLCTTPLFAAQSPLEEARGLERSGDVSAARATLQRAAEGAPHDVSALLAYAEFLDRHGAAERRAAYERVLSEGGPASSAPRTRVLRRLVALDLLAGDKDAANRHRADYRASGGAGMAGSLLSAKPAAPDATPFLEIPGPLRSFARMAALSPDLQVGDLMPALARNVVTNGYQAVTSNEALDQTEYLKLIVRYLSQARELDRLSGASKQIRIATCESTETAELLRILGYRMRGGCGSDVVLETVNATRAFLTVDSGFPLAELEQALRTNRAFAYDFKPTRVPLLYPLDYWLGVKPKAGGEAIDAFLGDPALCRLYLSLSKLDKATADQLRQTVPVQRIKAFAHVLDFYGGMFEVRNGKAVVPGGARSEKMWGDLVGVDPGKGVAFFERLIAKDDGWLASYFDSLSRIHGPVEQYLTEPERLKRFYLAVRGRVTSPGPARPVFRANTDMMLLTTRLRLEADGRPHIPGSIEVWKNLFIRHPHGKYDGKLTRMASTWKESDDVVEALFALCRKAVENEPLKIYMSLTDLERHRAQPLAPATVDRLARDFRFYGSQYTTFAESPQVSDATILLYLDTAKGLSEIKDQGDRSDAAGLFQALVGIWQILARQQLLPAGVVDQTLAGIVGPFSKARNTYELFDAGRGGLNLLLKAAGPTPGTQPQERLLGLLAGSASPGDAEAHGLVVQDMMRIFEAQRLVSLNTLFELADNLERVSRGEKLDAALVTRLANRIAEVQLPRAALSGVEKNALSFGYWTEKHVEAQRKLNLRMAVEKAANNAEKLRDLRGALVPFLRDTLVGMNYAHYAPPGAQILYTNPLFVRSHDFLGMQQMAQTWRQTEVYGTGWPASAGGRLVGSLAGLPYALAEAEQNFLIPSREQALIWGDLVPQMILSVKIPRWWNAEPVQLRWVGLHMRYAESLVAESVFDARTRERLLSELARQAAPARLGEVAELVEAGDVKTALDHITPSEMFVVASGILKQYPDEGGALAEEIRRVAAEAPDRVSAPIISRLFGTPKPTLTNSYQPELLYLRTFPTLMGYSSRIMAESWESTVLYWVGVADELNVAPARLNILIPEWTQQTVERIFATHLEDWPALLRSMRLVAEDARIRLRRPAGAEQKASLD